MIRSIVVALDGSRFAERALPLAAAIAGRTGALIRLVRVHLPLPFSALPAGRFDTVERARRTGEAEYLKRVAGHPALSGHAVETAVLDGPVAFTLRAAGMAHADTLLLLTSHRRRPLRRALSGNVADALVGTPGVPILLAGIDREDRTGAFGRVLVLLDGSEAAERVLYPAVSVAGTVDVEYVLVHVERQPGSPPLRPPPAERATWSLERSTRLLELAGARVTTRTPTATDVVGGVADVWRPGDLLAMETEARKGLGRLLLGSTADRVVRTLAGAPVLLFSSQTMSKRRPWRSTARARGEPATGRRKGRRRYATPGKRGR